MMGTRAGATDSWRAGAMDSWRAWGRISSMARAIIWGSMLMMVCKTPSWLLRVVTLPATELTLPFKELMLEERAPT